MILDIIANVCNAKYLNMDQNFQSIIFYQLDLKSEISWKKASTLNISKCFKFYGNE